MKRGIHPVLQAVTLVTSHGRVVKVWAGKVFHVDKPYFIRDPGKESETVGQLAKFKKRFEISPQKKL